MADAFETVDPRTLTWPAVLASMAPFALEHREIAAGFLAGLAYSLLYRRHGDLRVAVVAHAVTNGALALCVVSWGGCILVISGQAPASD